MAKPHAEQRNTSNSAGSILERPFVEGVLEAAQENLRRDKSLMPVLFFRAEPNELGILPLELPATTEEKYAYFGILGASLTAARKRVTEALFLSETWFVSMDPKQGREEEIRPSEHPRRREAISLVGRDAAASRFTFVVQLFHWERKRLLLDAREVEEYNIPAGTGSEAVGLLDAFFLPDPSNHASHFSS